MTAKKVAAAGGGVLLIMYAGLLKAFEEGGIEIEEAAGTSAGSWFSAFAGSGMSPDMMREMLLDFIPIDRLLDPDPLRFFFRNGLIRFKKIETLLSQHLPVTFADTTIPIAMFTSNIDRQEVAEWSTRKTPNAKLAPTVCNSSRIPGVFQEAIIDGEAHTDGGMAYNFPIDHWNDEENRPPENLLGVCFSHTVHGPLPPRKPPYRIVSNSLRHYAGHLSLVMRQATLEAVQDARAPLIVLSIPKELRERGVSSMSFDIQKDDAAALIEAGRVQARAQLSKLQAK